MVKYVYNPFTEDLDAILSDSDLSGFVPYTGATGDVDLGAKNFDANNITGDEVTASNFFQGRIGDFTDNTTRLIFGTDTVNSLSFNMTAELIGGIGDFNGLNIESVNPTDSGSGNVRDVTGLKIADITATDASGDVRSIVTGAGKIDFGDELNMNTNKIIGVVDPTADQDAATKKYVDDTIASDALLLDGSNDPMTGDINFGDSLGTVYGDDNDYSVEWDGSDAVHTVSAGDFVFAGGNVGIGTASPDVELDILGTVKSSGNLYVHTSNTQAADRGGRITLGGSYTDAGDQLSFAAIWGSKETSTSGDAAGNLAFHTKSGAGGVMVEAVMIDSTQNVHLVSDSNKLYFGEGSDYSIEWDGTDAVHTITAGDFVFTGGNVGIGTTSPVARLDVLDDGTFTANELLFQASYTPSTGGTRGIRLTGPATDTAGSPFIFDTNNAMSFRVDSSGGIELDESGEVHLPLDSQKLYFGAGSDASLEYDPTFDGMLFTQNSDTIGIQHDGYNAYMKWSDGGLRLETDEGTNTPSTVEIRGKGTGQGLFRVYSGDNSAYMYIYQTGQIGVIETTGTTSLNLQNSADANVDIFSGAADGESPELRISGFYSGDARRRLEIGVGKDAADTASFDGVSNYYFDGNVGIGTTTPGEKLEVNGKILADDKIMFTQTDGNEFIDSLNDGYMDYGATTGHRFNASIDAGVNDIQTTGSVKGVHKTSDGTNAVADGTYTMGLGTSTNGTITIKDGLITALTEASDI